MHDPTTVPATRSRPAGPRPTDLRPTDLVPGGAGLQRGEVSADDAARLRAAVTRIGKALRATAASAGLSPSALDVLGTVVRRGPIRMTDLAALDGLNPTMLSRLAAKLEEGGLVRRLPSSGDGRSVSLEATEHGAGLQARVLAERLEVLLGATSQLAGEERAALVAALPALEAVAEILRPGARQPVGAPR